MSESKMNIPKFGSFRPKPTPLSPQNPKEEEKQKSKERARDEGTVHRRRRSRGRDKGRNISPDRVHSPKRNEALEPEIFVVDRKGDEKNLMYGSIHRYSVPPFHRIGAGSVLGAPPDVRIDRDYSDDKSIVLNNVRHSKSGNSREKYAFAKMEKPRLLKVRPDAISEGDLVIQSDYLPLQVSRGKKRKRAGNGQLYSSESDNERDYRSIHGKAKSDQPLDDAFQYVSESESSNPGGAMNDSASARQKNLELSRKVEQSPHDIEAWLALIEHQDKVLRGEDERRRITNAEMRSTADIKIHMYEKALEKATSLSERERLLQGMMAEGSKIWEVKYQSDRWEQISKENIDSLLLWKSYLDFKQTTFATFRYEEIRELYIKRIKLLLKTTAPAETNAKLLYHELIYILLRFTIFARESGYTELAVAIWQSILEINFRSPLLSNQDWKSDFQDFWDSEVPRIGESASLGWLHFKQNPERVNVTNTQIDEVDNFLDKKQLFKSWTGAERLRHKSSRIPAKTMDEVAEDDPFRVILFSDVVDLLIALPPDADLQKSMLDAFLLFCRLPPMSGSDQDACRSWHADPFIRGELLEADIDWIRHEHPARIHEESKDATIMSALNTPGPNFSGSPESMFGSPWFSSLEVWRNRYTGDNAPVTYAWVRNTLKQLMESNFREDLAEYYLAFEWCNESEGIKKTAKNLLKSHSGSLRLYNAYAMIEWSRGNKEVAGGVFTAALTMGNSMPEGERTESIFLWKSWIWACLEAGDNTSALNHLLSIADGTPCHSTDVSPTAIIRAKRHLSSNRDYLISSGNAHHAVIYTECLAILDYLSSKSSKEPQSSNQGDIASAISVIIAFSNTLVERNLTQTSSHELLLQSAARLLFHHVRIGPFRPALLREHFTQFLRTFPHNTVFLSLYSWNESRLRIDSRVRNLLASSGESFSSQMFKIKWEIENGTIHSTRSAFETALSSPVSRSSASVWKLYLLFCLETPQFRTRGKDIWYRALRACPWAKELYMSGFELISEEDIGFGELKGTWKVMGEKELRVHVDLEDRFDELLEQ